MNTVFFFEQAFNGLSIASILLLAALGLALSFGLMRVINMAHGEMLMVAGYLTYLSSLWLPGPAYLLLAFPLAFVGTALLGMVLETTVIRRLYKRPLDSLLATWVSVLFCNKQAGKSLVRQVSL
jgi:urea transport system permease protein